MRRTSKSETHDSITATYYIHRLRMNIMKEIINIMTDGNMFGYQLSYAHTSVVASMDILYVLGIWPPIFYYKLGVSMILYKCSFPYRTPCSCYYFGSWVISADNHTWLVYHGKVRKYFKLIKTTTSASTHRCTNTQVHHIRIRVHKLMVVIFDAIF